MSYKALQRYSCDLCAATADDPKAGTWFLYEITREAVGVRGVHANKLYVCSACEGQAVDDSLMGFLRRYLGMKRNKK